MIIIQHSTGARSHLLATLSVSPWHLIKVMETANGCGWVDYFVHVQKLNPAQKYHILNNPEQMDNRKHTEIKISKLNTRINKGVPLSHSQRDNDRIKGAMITQENKLHPHFNQVPERPIESD